MAAKAAILDSQTEWFKHFWISMSLRCFTSSFGSIQLTVCGEMSFDECRLTNVVWRISRWPPSWISKRINFSNPESLCCYDASHQVLAQSDLHVRFGRYVWYLGYRNRTILAIRNLYNAPMPPIKFQLNLTYGLGRDVIGRISRWALWWPSWISELSELNDFSNYESLCHCDASHQVLAQFNLQFGKRCHLKNS